MTINIRTVLFANDTAPVVIDQLAAHLQERGVRVRLWLHPEDPELYETPGAGYLIAMAHTLLHDEVALIAGDWFSVRALADLGVGRSRVLHRAALAANAVLVAKDLLSGHFGGLTEGLPGIPRVPPNADPDTLLRALAASAPADNAGPGAGAWRPGESVLLVGDRPNNARHTLKQRLPFASLHKGGCSMWLGEQLDAAAVPEERLYWINAYDPFDRLTDHAFLDELKPRGIVALGANAARWCQQADVAYRQVTHPQAHKRFHGSEPYALGPLLRELLGLPDPQENAA